MDKNAKVYRDGGMVLHAGAKLTPRPSNLVDADWKHGTTDGEIFAVVRSTGAFIVGFVANPWELADTLIHEMSHGRLFALEDAGSLFDEAACDPLGDERYYSPWRDDPG